MILCLVSAVFLPALVSPNECKGKSKELNLPLCLAWSSSARNHFIPLVGVQGGELDHLLYSHACVLSPTDKYEGQLIRNAHSEILCQQSKLAMRTQCVLVATTLLHSGAKFHSFLYTGSKTVCVSMESCYGGMSTN